MLNPSSAAIHPEAPLHVAGEISKRLLNWLSLTEREDTSATLEPGGPPHQAIELSPFHASAYYSLGMALANKGDTLEAIKALQISIVIEPGFADAHHSLGQLLVDINDLPNAILSFENTIKAGPPSSEPYNNIGVCYQLLGEFEKSIEYLKIAIDLSPDDAVPHRNLASALYQSDHLSEALDYCQRGIELAPDDPQAFSVAGVVLAKLNQATEAIDAFRKAIELQPDFSAAYHEIGVQLEVLGQHVEAIESFEKALSLDPTSEDTYVAIGCAHSSVGLDQKAFAWFDKCLQINPNRADASYNIGQLLSRQERYRDAIPYYLSSIQSDSSNISACFNLFIAQAKCGEQDQAIATIYNVLDIVKETSDYQELEYFVFELGKAFFRFKNNIPETFEQDYNLTQMDDAPARLKAVAADYGLAPDVAKQALEAAAKTTARDIITRKASAPHVKVTPAPLRAQSGHREAENSSHATIEQASTLDGLAKSPMPPEARELFGEPPPASQPKPSRPKTYTKSDFPAEWFDNDDVVRAARRRAVDYKTRDKSVTLAPSELERFRAATRFIRAYERQQARRRAARTVATPT